MMIALLLLQMQAAPTQSVTEQVNEQVSEPDRALVFPSLGGPAGTFRVLSTDVGAAGTFRIALHGEFFQANSFLVTGDEDARMLGTIAIAYTPWKYLELYTAFRASSNRNTRTDPSRTDPEVITSLGDPSLGVKGRYRLTDVLEVGADTGLKFINSVSGLSFDGDATNLWFTGIASADLRNSKLHVPVRTHLNVGYLYDKSSRLVDLGMPPRPAQTRIAAEFGYGMGRTRFRVGAAADAPLHIGSVEIDPFAEYHFEVATGDADTFWQDPSLMIASDQLSGRVAQFLTVGVRAAPMRGLTLDLGTDIGLSSVGFEYGTPTPPWNLIFGASYAYDPIATTKVTRTVVRNVVEPPHDGRIRGSVVSIKGGPVPNAVVTLASSKAGRLATSDDGSFTSFAVAPGAVDVTVSADGYEPASARAVVHAGEDTKIDFSLQPKPPMGRLHVRVVDDQGKTLDSAIVRVTGEVTKQLPAVFDEALPVGAYTLRAEAPEHLVKERTVELKQNADEGIEFTLRARPAESRVELKSDRIVTKGTVHFQTGKADIALDSRLLLDEIADVLVQHPEIKRLRVEGHTDNTGKRAKNLQLSKDRAASVVAYLVSQGIAASRLDSEGYGQDKPLVPNISNANKEKNRRVEFKILEGEVKP